MNPFFYSEEAGGTWGGRGGAAAPPEPAPEPEASTIEQPVASSADEPDAVAGTALGSDEPAPE
jgi:hypothetical protein